MQYRIGMVKCGGAMAKKKRKMELLPPGGVEIYLPDVPYLGVPLPERGRRYERTYTEHEAIAQRAFDAWRERNDIWRAQTAEKVERLEAEVQRLMNKVAELERKRLTEEVDG
jgi:hypothetical protein